MVVTGFNVHSQTNLVYNGDFEIYDTCPQYNSEIDRCLGWTAPTKLGTSDYFNVCNNTITPGKPAGVPQNFVGYQQPLSGNGYCGIYTWDVDFGIDYREYIQTSLSQTLTAGKLYHLSFYVSNEGSAYSLQKIGAVFSSQDYSGNNYDPILVTPQVVNTTGYLIDSINWMKVEGTFIASGNEQYLTIGYFENSSNVTDTINTHTTPFVAKTSYYYIDDVELYETDLQLDLPNVFTPNNDGSNDLFEVRAITGEVYTIYNRWGQKVFDSSIGNASGWDGRTNAGQECPSGTYFYIIKLEDLDLEYKGTIQLLR